MTLGPLNHSSLRLQRALASATEDQSRSTLRLASGQRILRASDDAAGLAVSSELTNRSRLFGQAIRNIGDAISFLNIAEGTLQSLGDLLDRYGELAQQSANGVLSVSQRKALDIEGEQLRLEFNRLTQGVRFNGRAILDGSLSELTAQIGITGEGSLRLNVSQELRTKRGLSTFTSGTATGLAPTGSESVDTTAIADLDGDGFADMVSGGRISWGNGTGSFTAGPTLTSPGGIVQLADINGDGQLDVVTSGTTGFRVFSNLGGRSFQTTATVVGSSGAQRFQARDIDGNGSVDLVGIDRVTGVLQVARNDGSGNFSVSTQATGITSGTAVLIDLADMNSDGQLDIVLGGVNNSSGAILYGGGQGSFGTQTAITLTGMTFGNRMRLVDFDLDGQAEIVTQSSSAVAIGGASSNGFNLSATLASGFGYDSLIVADINNDGFMDVSFRDTSAIPGASGVFLNDGSGGFSLSGAASHFGAAATTAMGFGDINGDGVLDFINASTGSSSIGVSLQNTADTTQLPRISLLSQSDARAALSIIDQFKQRVIQEQSVIGAGSRRLESALALSRSLGVETSTAANRITDIDVAEEVSLSLRAQISSDVTAALLAQGRPQAEIALTLLRSA